MPSYPQPAKQYFGNQIKSLKQAASASATGGTQYVVDPTVPPLPAGSPPPTLGSTYYNCRLILGDVRCDNWGNSTGLPASSSRSNWGMAVYNPTAGTWSQP